MFRISVFSCALLLLAGCVLPMAAQEASTSQAAVLPPATTFYGCVNNSTGAIKIVTANTKCKATEHKIHWNQVGPQGPKGARGPQGPQGPQGTQGPPGISVGNFASGSSGPLASSPGTLIAQTNPIPSTGTYYISASALLHVDANDGAYCYTTSAGNGGGGIQGGSSAGAATGVGVYQQATMTDAIFAGAGDVFQLWCYSATGAANSFVFNSGLSATLINSSFAHKKQAQHATPPSIPGGPVTRK
jgi:hypothetical protein